MSALVRRDDAALHAQRIREERAARVLAFPARAANPLWPKHTPNPLDEKPGGAEPQEKKPADEALRCAFCSHPKSEHTAKDDACAHPPACACESFTDDITEAERRKRAPAEIPKPSARMIADARRAGLDPAELAAVVRKRQAAAVSITDRDIALAHRQGVTPAELRAALRR